MQHIAMPCYRQMMNETAIIEALENKVKRLELEKKLLMLEKEASGTCSKTSQLCSAHATHPHNYENCFVILPDYPVEEVLSSLDEVKI